MTIVTAAESHEVAHVFPVVPSGHAGYQHAHHDYPATDIFVGCGATVVSPVDGDVVELSRTDSWTAAVDDPATRGGLFVSIIGDDGVRYYLAHLRSIVDTIDVGTRVAAGDVLGEMGRTGRAGACHTHFALSPPCPNAEWWVRRGVIWPYQYLRDWEAAKNVSPAPEIAAWALDHPDACTTPPP